MKPKGPYEFQSIVEATDAATRYVRETGRAHQVVHRRLHDPRNDHFPFLVEAWPYFKYGLAWVLVADIRPESAIDKQDDSAV